MELHFRAEDSDELLNSIFAHFRSSGWTVPEWIVQKCRERMVELASRNFSGTLSVNGEVFKGQLADINIIETPTRD
jgi:hypothetical protein